MTGWLKFFLKSAPAPATAKQPDAALMARVEAVRRENAIQALDDQVADIYQTQLAPAPALTRYGLWAAATVLLAFGAWAAITVLDEVTSGTGKVVPTSREQIVQSIEPGVVTELMVKEGQVVEEGQSLVRIDDVKLGSNMKESQVRVDALQAAAARLKAESMGLSLSFPPDLARRNPQAVRNETEAYTSRRRTFESGMNAQQQALKLSQDELRITEPLAAKGLVSDLDVIRIQRVIAETKGRMQEMQTKFRSEASTELARVEAELGSQSATLTGRTDSYRRTVLFAPKRGIVKNIRVTTQGAVVQSGQEIMEIIPLDDSLMIETRIRPVDIAFLRPGLPAIVKISAYDSGIYGWLEGELLQISPDTLRDEVRREETYYRALVKTKTASLTTPTGATLPIIPGMQAVVDIKTGKKSVLSYLFKPVLRAREALRER